MAFHLVSTKAKRAVIAKQLEAVALECGATCEITPALFEPTKGLDVNIWAGPYQVIISLEGPSSVNALLAHWHTAPFSLAHYPADFGSAIHGSVNTCHYGKATSCEDTVEELLASVRGGLNALKALESVEA